MIAHFVICTLGSQDLVELAVASIHKFAGDATLDLIQLPESALGDANAHGRALDQWRLNPDRVPIPDEDVVVIMDPDVAILSPLWRREMEAVFTDPKVGIWGAGCREDFGLRIHPSMMVIRGACFNESSATFRPFYPEGTYEWRDTGGWYCKCVYTKGWRLARVERGPDWHSVSAWGSWAHLGGGTWSDSTRLTLFQRWQRRRAVTLRRRFIAEVKKVLAS